MEVFYIIIFGFALFLGSFLNVVILRLGSGESFIYGRSHCVHCKKELSWKDLVPLFSFIYIRGKCRYCKTKISWQYPLVELITAIFFVLVFVKLGFPENIFDSIYLFLAWCLFAVFIVISLRDIRQFRVDNKLVLLSLFLSIILSIVGSIIGEADLFTAYIGAFSVFLFFLLLFLGTKGKGIGMGDVKLSFVIALFVGLNMYELLILWLFFAFVFGGIIGVLLIIFKDKHRKDKLPFAPFLVYSAFIAFLAGTYLWEKYILILAI